MRHRIIPIVLAATVAAGGYAANAIATGPEPCADNAPPGSDPAATTEADPSLTGRCAIDAEAYYLDYESPEFEDSGVALPSPAATTAAVSPIAVPNAEAAADAGVAGPVVPVLPAEPGVLDDNTFVDSGDSTWIVTGDDRESTFALDVDTGSYRVAQAFLDQGYRPDADSIRPEEWINAYDYGDPPATGGDALAVTIDSSGPVTEVGDPTLVRVGISTRELAPGERPPANITFVIDTSGSMDIRERLGLVKASLALLVKNLRADDTISIVTYGDMATPVLRPTPISEWPEIVDAIDDLQPGGSTNMEDGLRLGYVQARESFDPDAINVVVLASDGVANVGTTDADELTAEITRAGDEGIHLVTVGYGMGNYNDHLMEQLADQGDGFYSYVDTFAEAVRLFVTDLTPTLAVVAEQAKVQVVFDPAVVSRYRLIGYENRRLDDAQFSDDTVDAGELGAGHRVSAVYEIEMVEGADAAASPGTVRLRWTDPATGEVTEVEAPIDLAVGDPDAPSLRLAALVGYTAEVLKGNSVVTARGITLDDLLVAADALAADDVEGADDLVEFLTIAIHAEPVPDTEGVDG